MPGDTVDMLMTILAGAIAPLEDSLRSPEDAILLIEALGWELPPGVNEIGLSVVNVSDLREKLMQLQVALKIEGNTPETVSLQAEVVGEVANTLNSIRQVADKLPTVLAGAGNYLVVTQIEDQLPKRLIDYLLIRFFQENTQPVFHILIALGIFRLEPMQADPTTFQSEHLHYQIDFDRIPLLFSSPSQLFRDVYGWGTPNFDSFKLLARLGNILQMFGVQPEISNLPARVETKLLGAAPLPNSSSLAQLKLSLVKGLAWNSLDIGLMAYGLRPTTGGGSDAGIGITPYLQGSTDLSFEIRKNFFFEIDTQLNIQKGLVLMLRADKPISVVSDFTSNSQAISAGQLRLALVYRMPSGERVSIFDLPPGFTLAMRELGFSTGFGIAPGNKLSAFGELGLKDGRFQISGGQGDGFLSKILPSDGVGVDFDTMVGVSSETGLYFQGSAGLEVQLPIHLDLGPIDVQAVYLSLRLGGDGAIPLEISTVIKADIGPLKAVVERFGVKLTISFPQDGGNAGPLNIAAAFKPPNGVGLAIDASVVKGGGFLRFDPDKEEYDGVLELDLNGIVSVKAIGLITTRLPDGSKGFSLLLIITAEFGSPIQLGLGFTLSAVGGLLGLNRTMRLEIIATGIRDGGINSIMFPQNVVENAPRIISDLKKYFPVEADIFLIGPMLKIGWGTPNLVTVSLGVIIEIPGNIAILGVLKVALPDEDNVVVLIQVNFMGAIEFDKKRLWFFASMYDSRVLFITLEGQMGLLVGWGDEASFVVSVGGFHPAFNPPPLPFGAIARIAISILNTDYARIRVEAYFAVTSNTVQFGAAVEVFFGVSAFNIDGHLAFDALFRFSPFYFIITISASLSVKVFGIGLFSVSMRGSLEGPTPWHIEGTGSISLLFFDIDVDFSHTWGTEDETILPPISVMPLLTAEFQKLEKLAGGPACQQPAPGVAAQLAIHD